ncbi:MAG: glycosyltransferase [Alphaproteobacteria bacterium]|nr:glycosyltransferase [Alphaproteobacteria bacterium]
MNILFLHRNFPSQFVHLAKALAKNKKNEVYFITNNYDQNLTGVKRFFYQTKREIPENTHKYVKFYEDSIIHGQAAAEVAIRLKRQGFKPNIIYGHSWGLPMYMKDIFPDVPLLCYFEWFYNSTSGDFGFDKNRIIHVDDLAKLRSWNAPFLVDLYSCDAGISPTKFQKSQIPKEFQSKVKVLHDGIDTDFYAPDQNAKFVIKDENLTFTKNDEVVTYGTRGMEAYRGFPEFMKALNILLKKRPKLHAIIAGEDRVVYGPKLKGTTYKTLMLEQLDLDLKRVHFVGHLPPAEYAKLLQISSAHVYLTYPFVCSWSLTDAMSSACPLIASSTPSITEFVEDKKDGLLFDFFNFEEQAEKIEYALDHPNEMKILGKNARNKILQKYSVKKLLPKHLAYLESIIQNYHK